MKRYKSQTFILHLPHAFSTWLIVRLKAVCEYKNKHYVLLMFIVSTQKNVLSVRYHFIHFQLELTKITFTWWSWLLKSNSIDTISINVKNKQIGAIWLKTINSFTNSYRQLCSFIIMTRFHKINASWEASRNRIIFGITRLMKSLLT